MAAVANAPPPLPIAPLSPSHQLPAIPASAASSSSSYPSLARDMHHVRRAAAPPLTPPHARADDHIPIDSNNNDPTIEPDAAFDPVYVLLLYFILSRLVNLFSPVLRPTPLQLPLPPSVDSKPLLPLSVHMLASPSPMLSALALPPFAISNAHCLVCLLYLCYPSTQIPPLPHALPWRRTRNPCGRWQRNSPRRLPLTHLQALSPL